jgi:hypothetical protein
LKGLKLDRRERDQPWSGGPGNLSPQGLCLCHVPDLVGAENPVTLCDLGILADQAADSVTPHYPYIGAWSRWMRASGRRALLQRPMGPMSVVVGVLAQNESQVPFAGDQQPIQALAAGTADPAFRDRVAPHRQLHPVRMIGTAASG